MQLNVRDAAELLFVSEKTIYRWVKQNELPAYKINGQYRFSRAELLEWATSHRINISTQIFQEIDAGSVPSPGLAEALRTGGIHYRIGGTEKASVLKACIEVMPLPEGVDRKLLFQVIMARETLGTTAVGDGVAIPHVRNPIVLHLPRPMVSLFFLDSPIEFGALDGKPVHTLFVIVSPTISAHLNLLSQLAFALRQTEFKEIIARRGSREEIDEEARRIARLIDERRESSAASRDEEE